MNIYLGKHFEEFVRKQVESGRYANASEVVREALRRYGEQRDQAGAACARRSPKPKLRSSAVKGSKLLTSTRTSRI